MVIHQNNNVHTLMTYRQFHYCFRLPGSDHWNTNDSRFGEIAFWHSDSTLNPGPKFEKRCLNLHSLGDGGKDHFGWIDLYGRR